MLYQSQHLKAEELNISVSIYLQRTKETGAELISKNKKALRVMRTL